MAPKARRKADRAAAEASYNRTRNKIAEQFDEVKVAHERALGKLRQIGQQHLLEEAKPVLPAARPESNPVTELDAAADKVGRALRRLWDTAYDWQSWDEARTRKQAWFFLVAVILALAILSTVGPYVYNALLSIITR